MLTIPEHATVIELPTSTIWREDSGIVCAISRSVKTQTLEQAQENVRAFREAVGDSKVCMLIDVTHSSESTYEVRAYAAEELPKIVKAIAMVSGSALGRMLANLFFNLKSQPYPVKMFNDEHQAREWLKQYL